MLNTQEELNKLGYRAESDPNSTGIFIFKGNEKVVSISGEDLILNTDTENTIKYILERINAR